MGKILDALLPKKNITISAPGFDMTINVSRFSRNVKAAQRFLMLQVPADCDRFIPFRDGALKQSLSYPEGVDGTVIEWNTPYAHYQYEGEVYINPKYNASGFIGKDGLWHGWKGPKIPSGRRLQYHTPGTGDHWFERAAAAYGDEWIQGAGKIAMWGRR